MRADEWNVIKECIAGKTVGFGDSHVLHHTVLRLGVNCVLKLGWLGVQRTVPELLVEARWGECAAGQCDAAWKHRACLAHPMDDQSLCGLFGCTHEKKVWEKNEIKKENKNKNAQSKNKKHKEQKREKQQEYSDLQPKSRFEKDER